MENPLQSNRDYEADARSILRDAKLRTESILLPVGTIGVSILQGSTNMRDATKKLMKSSGQDDRLEKEINLFFEFIYFFMHWTLRLAIQLIDHSKLMLLQDFLLEIVPPAAIDTYFSHLSNDAKNDLIAEFVEKLDMSEVEYGSCSPDGLALVLIKKLMGILVNEHINVPKLFSISILAIREFGEMQLGKSIDEFGQIKMSEQDMRRICEHLNEFRMSS